MSNGFVLAEPPKSICILRLSAIGDVCHMIAVVQMLQRTYPNVPITWIVGKIEFELVHDLPGIEFVVFDKKQGWRSYLNLYRQFRQRHFDVLLHMQVALRASLASLCISARHRIGFDKARAKDGQWLFTRYAINKVNKQHVLEGFQQFAACLNVPISKPTWSVPIPAAAITKINELIPSTKKILVIHPSASNSERNWSSENYAAIADYAAKQADLQVVLTGGPQAHEQQLAEKIIQQTESPIINLVGKLSLKELLAVLQRALVVIGPDTGPIHMATVVNTPVIGLYASSNPHRTGPYRSLQWTVNEYPNALKRFMQFDEQQAPWGKRVHGKNVMSLITVKSVQNKLDLLLAEIASAER